MTGAPRAGCFASEGWGALEVYPVTDESRRLFPLTFADFPPRARYVATYYRRGVRRRRILMATDSYHQAMADARYLCGYPDPDDPRSQPEEKHCRSLLPEHDYRPVGPDQDGRGSLYRCARCTRELTIEVVPYETEGVRR